MKVTVDEDRCRGHGMCLTLCPEVFSMTDDGYAIADPEEVPDGPRGRRERGHRELPRTSHRRNRLKAEEIVVPKGYVVITEDVKDPAGMGEYAKLASKAMAGATILAFDPNAEQIEGEWHGTQTVLLEFESVEAAREWYNSDAYQEAAKLRQAAADCNGAILSGLG